VACSEALVAEDICKGECAVVRRGHLLRTRVLIAVVEAFLIGCLVLMVGCSGVRSEAPQKEQGHTEVTKEKQGRTRGAASEEDRCGGTRTIDLLKSASVSTVYDSSI
jgi:hypothetical protein